MATLKTVLVVYAVCLATMAAAILGSWLKAGSNRTERKSEVTEPTRHRRAA